MNIKFLIPFLCSIVILLVSCPSRKGQEYILLVNNTNKCVGFVFSTKQDTLFYCSDMGVVIPFVVDSFSSFSLDDGDSYSSWDSWINQITFYVIDEGVYKMYWTSPCDTIYKYVPVLQRYRLKLEDLQKLDWTVAYPPTEAMKDMDIYPPYKDTHDD